ncbi:MAG: DUF3794 domain-containing protein [Clostridia bacterium]|nr:DUF3794 domain-containing protein [Clostridia bacterium]
MILLGIIDVENCLSGMTVNEKVIIKKIEVKVLNGRKINIKAVLEVEIKVYSNDNIEIISNINNIEDIQILNNNKIINSLVGQGNTRVYAKDTISIDNVDDLAEIMKSEIKIINKEIKLSYNKVLAKADAEVSILYLTEDNRIKNITTKIPVMGFVDIENISDNNICDVDYKIKNLIIKPNNSDNHSIYVEAEIEIICFAYETKNINLIEDLYSISSELKFTQKEVITMSGKQNIKQNYNISEQISIPEIENRQLYHVKTISKILNTNIKSNKIMYEGELNLEFLYEVNNGIDVKNVQIPFDFEIISDNINEDCVIDTNVDIKTNDFVVNGRNIDTNVELEFNVSISTSKRLNIIDEVSEEETKDNNIYSMIIYFVKPGDTLWKIAKKFRSTIEDIARVNEIEDINKIYPNEQLYIPKFVKKSVTV